MGESGENAFFELAEPILLFAAKQFLSHFHEL